MPVTSVTHEPTGATFVVVERDFREPPLSLQLLNLKEPEKRTRRAA